MRRGCPDRSALRLQGHSVRQRFDARHGDHIAASPLLAAQADHIRLAAAQVVHIRIGKLLTVRVHDDGCGIEDVPAAMQPFYSTGDGNERSGMGFCVMQTFMDAVEVESAVGKGTTVTMRKYITGEVGLHRERMLDEIG